MESKLIVEATPIQHAIHIALVTDRPGQVGKLSAILEQICPVQLLPPAINPLVVSDLALCIVLDADLSSELTIKELEPLRNSMLAREIPCIFVLDSKLDEAMLHLNLQRTKGFGVVNYITRPLVAEEVLRILPPMYERARERDAEQRNNMTGCGVAAAHQILASLMEAASGKRSFSFDQVIESDGLILDALAAWGIKPWMDTVRRHHDSTYRHSLLVTGFAVTLAQKLKVRREDQRRVARAGLLHDVGKAFIPVNILDKPGKLTDAEMGEVRKHPRLGYDLLVQFGGFPEEILNCVLHHHELIDGSGYPDGLKGNEIADLVRMVTIADIFSALIERRAYRDPMPPETAFRIMQEMGAKLDVDLLREFRAVVQDSI